MAEGLGIYTTRRQEFDSYFPLEPSSSSLNTSSLKGDGSHERANASDEVDYASLPFPAPLASLRADFCAPSFDCDSFLLRHQRHGQLDDLALELRNLSASLASELVRGVEDDYEAFIGLGKIDAQKVGDLTRGVQHIVDEVTQSQEHSTTALAEIEQALARHRVLARRKREALRTLQISRTIDECLYLLEEEDEEEGADLTAAVEAYETLTMLLTTAALPEYEQTRFDDLKVALKTRITSELQKAADADSKLEMADLLRRIGPNVVG